MKYTEDQKKRMIEKIRSMKNGEIFDLNKKDANPITCKIVRTHDSFSLVGPKINDEVLLTVNGNPNGYDTLKIVVDTIEDWINDWEFVSGQYLEDLARVKRKVSRYTGKS